MPEVRETRLPGVGVRHEFTTTGGELIGVLSHRNGRREVVVYDADDPDASTTVLHLSAEDARTLADLFGANQVSEAVNAVQLQIEGLALEWITVPETSRFARATIAEGEFRTRTGSSIVAVMRGEETVPAPGPEYRFAPGDVVVATGTVQGLAHLRGLIES